MVASYSHSVLHLLIRNPPDPVEKIDCLQRSTRGAASGAVLRAAIASNFGECPIRGVLRSTKRVNGLRSTIPRLFENISWQTLQPSFAGGA
jgi:hypothetical protein